MRNLVADSLTGWNQNLEALQGIPQGPMQLLQPFVCILPPSSHDVQDDRDASLVVLGPTYPHAREGGSDSRAITAAKSILESRGNTPRLFRNTLAFLAADDTRLQDLEDGIRRFLAWQSILAEREPLDLPPHQVRQAESQQAAADSAVVARIIETYQWLIVPVQSSPQAALQWQAIRLAGQGSLAHRASRRMRNDELLITVFAGTRLRMELDRIPLWRGNNVSVRQLVDDFASYSYLPRLREPAVLLEAIRNGLSLLTWEQDSFAYADGYDDGTGRYRGLQSGPQASGSAVGNASQEQQPALAAREHLQDSRAATFRAPWSGIRINPPYQSLPSKLLRHLGAVWVQTRPEPRQPPEERM